MGSIVERVKALGLPLEDVVVIGSGLLDAYGLREAHDVDLAVSETLFDELKKTGSYTLEIKHNDEVLLADELEIWMDRGPYGAYDTLKQEGVVIDGVRFASARTIMEYKRQRSTEKDMNDLRLLEEYTHGR